MPCRDLKTKKTVTYEADALVFAVGITGMQKIIRANKTLGERDEFRRVMNLRGIDVVSTRLWLDKRVATQYPANVLAGFDDDMGSTYFNLNDLHVRSAAPCRDVLAAPACLFFFLFCLSEPCILNFNIRPERQRGQTTPKTQSATPHCLKA